MFLLNQQTNKVMIPDGNIHTFLVDQPRLQEIARITGGIHELPDNAKSVADSLIVFFKTLREYEVVYNQTGAKQARLYQTTVRVVSQARQIDATSDSLAVRLNNFGYYLPSWENFVGILVLTIFLSLAWLVPFYRWSQSMKKEAERLLQDS